MRKLLLVLILLTFTACSQNRVISPKEGYAVGEVGDIMQTAWFDFQVDSVVRIGNQYENYQAAAGNQFILLTVTIRNNYSEDLNVYLWDFAIFARDGSAFWLADDLPLANQFSIDGEAVLTKKAAQTFSFLYEIPEDAVLGRVCFVEQYASEDGLSYQQGDVFYVDFELAE
ncbi:MAG: DUF4352 domain-containing protein [Erysipelotrichaceae bacterium]|jgi:hypothetical protein|nr:DUF4352 domain-containing protein [Erysipelotrichaceae bacterium]